ncbi:GNAT family N-acetyltransferase [Sulfurisoma sediminicola]|uniref:Acetyltransferase (GNAT) family protein n=2 Tax=Sulfurisoma sediminicola TaxID=1381557 RepID=A0A497XPG6_9PROT|nr:GNAT family N-acetyltransferase [Sulfurisoma sediminicola]RLJ68258.1 acetyltransferase (GNAT) family protein [Sulfurisoma sediminicola]
MIDASRYLERETLRNGLEVCFRAARPDDWERVVEAFNELDPESVYLRFFAPKKDLSEADLKNFREADFRNRVILLCTVMRDGREIVIASATYVRVGEADAEVAFVVEEDYHRLGIAGRLLRHLGRIARAGGIGTFVAEVLPHNSGMLGVFERSGWPTAAKKADGTVHVTVALNDG